MDRDDFRRRFKGRYKIRDPRFEDKLYEKYERDFRDAGRDDVERERVFALIDDEVSTYNLGRVRERADRERDRKKRENVIREEEITVRPRPGSYETVRSEALSEYIASVASMNVATIRFRERVLDGRVLTAAEAKKFLSSPVAATVRVGIRPRSVSFLDFELGEEAEDENGLYRRLRYDYMGRNVGTKLRPLLQVPGRSNSFMVYPGDAISSNEWWQSIPDQNANVLLFPLRSGDSVVAHSNSALDLLAKQASELVRRYLFELEEAAWFILTGKNPAPKYMSARLSSIDNDDLSRAVLTLTVEPWVPSKTVTKYYDEIRHEVVRSSGSVKDRTLAVFRFVTAHSREAEATPNKTSRWNHLLELWNEAYPDGHDWQFADYRDLRRAYIRGRDSVAFPLTE